MTKDRLAALKAVRDCALAVFFFFSECGGPLVRGDRVSGCFFGFFFYKFFFLSQAQSEDDDTGPDDVAVAIESHDGYMEEFFNEVSK